MYVGCQLNHVKKAYCTLWNETKRNEFISQNTNKSKSVFCEMGNTKVSNVKHSVLITVLQIDSLYWPCTGTDGNRQTSYCASFLEYNFFISQSTNLRNEAINSSAMSKWSNSRSQKLFQSISGYTLAHAVSFLEYNFFHFAKYKF